MIPNLGYTSWSYLWLCSCHVWCPCCQNALASMPSPFGLSHPTTAARLENVCLALVLEYTCPLPPPQIHYIPRLTNRSFISRSSARSWKIKQGGNDDHCRRRVCMNLDAAALAGPRALAKLHMPRSPTVLVISLSISRRIASTIQSIDHQQDQWIKSMIQLRFAWSHCLKTSIHLR